MLSPTTGYAALALALLASRAGQSVRVRFIADRCGVPGPYLSKIIHTLSRAGIVHTQRGAGGGARLLADPAALTLDRLCVLLDDPVLDRVCPLGLPGCGSPAGCIASEFCTPQRERIAAFLEHTTIAALAARIFGTDHASPPWLPDQGPRIIRLTPPGAPAAPKAGANNRAPTHAAEHAGGRPERSSDGPDGLAGITS